MSTSVDPFLIPIPQKFREDGEVLAWAKYLSKFNHDLRRYAVTGVAIELSNLNNRVSSLQIELDIRTAALELRISSLELMVLSLRRENKALQNTIITTNRRNSKDEDAMRMAIRAR